MAAGAVCLRKSHDILILSFCNIAKGQAKLLLFHLSFEKVMFYLEILIAVKDVLWLFSVVADRGCRPSNVEIILSK